MKFLDKIAINRFVIIITNFILGVLKLILPKNSIDKIDVPKPDRRWKPKWRVKDE
jgi:hypothetical protein